MKHESRTKGKLFDVYRHDTAPESTESVRYRTADAFWELDLTWARFFADQDDAMILANSLTKFEKSTSFRICVGAVNFEVDGFFVPMVATA